MTANEAIGTVDLLRPNSYTEDEKRTWLDRLEARIKTEIIDTHEGAGRGDANGDGVVDMDDVETIKDYVVNAIGDDGIILENADVYKDGKVNTIDANAVRRMVLSREEGALFAGAPYDEVYIFWLEAQIDYHNGEIQKYNNSITAFNHAYSAFERYYNRTHMPKRVVRKYF